MRDVERLVREVNRLHFARFHQTLASFGLGKGQHPILRYLIENDGCKQSDISHRECVTPATTTVMLQTMEKNGLIERRSDESDLRIMRVYITKKGKDIQKKCDEAMKNMISEVYEDFTEEEIETFRNLITKKRNKLRSLMEMEAEA